MKDYLRKGLFLFIISMCGLCPAWAGDEPGITHARAGFSMRPRMNAWSGGTVHLSNPSEQGKEVEVAIQSSTPKAGAEKFFYRRPVYLPPQSKRQERFYALLGNLTNFEVELYQKGIRIGRDTFPVKGIESNVPVFLIIDEVQGSYSFLSKLKLPKGLESPVPVYSHPKDLPEKWIGYDGIDTVILGAFNREDLNGHQVEALKEWVRAGGKLIISSGERYAQYQNGFAEELLSIRVLGVRRVDDLYLTEVYPADNKILLKQGAIPLILTSNYGNGKVIFLSFDASRGTVPGHNDKKGENGLWEDLVGNESNPFLEENTSLADKIEPIFTEVVGVSVPGFNQVVIFLTGYLILIISGHLIFMYRKRPELAWLVYILCVPLAIWLSYHIGQTGKRGPKLSINEVSVTELSPGGTSGRSSVYLGFFSPDGLTGSLVLRDPAAYGPRFSRALPDKPLFKVIDVQEDDVWTLKDINLSAGTLHTLSFNNIVTVGEGVDVQMTLRGDGLAGEITNRTGQALDDCLLIYNRYIKPVGSIPNGETIKIRMDDPADAGWHRGYSQKAIKAKQDVLREKIISSLWTPPIFAKPVKTDLVFSGWFSKPVFPVDAVNIDEKKEGNALMIMKVPVKLEEGDGILIPKGICDMELVNKASGALFYRGQWLRSQREAEITVDFVLPRICRGMFAEGIKIYFKFDAADVEVKLDAYNWQDGRWVAFPVENQITLSEARAYLHDGKVRLKVSGKPVREVQSEGLHAGFWEIKDLDVEVKGGSSHD